MRQALLNNGWQEDETDFIKDTGIYFKPISNRKYYILLQYDSKNRLLKATIRYRANNYQKSTTMTMEFLLYAYAFTIKQLINTIKELPTIECV